ncbi:hypothetical protein [Streptomyces sp. NPDC017520]|uniref:hypothetical protein n=1 Tax=Streptomyces sp. NPDC017520 TaxID=3364998 RepID=UPI0037B114C1
MITEPELVGEPGPTEPTDVVGGFDPGQGHAGGGRRRVRRLLWAAEDASMRVQVVEGGFVVTLALSSWMSPPDIDNGTDGLPDVVDQPEMLAYRADLISDTREVMKALKTG